MAAGTLPWAYPKATIDQVYQLLGFDPAIVKELRIGGVAGNSVYLELGTADGALSLTIPIRSAVASTVKGAS